MMSNTSSAMLGVCGGKPAMADSRLPVPETLQSSADYKQVGYLVLGSASANVSQPINIIPKLSYIDYEKIEKVNNAIREINNKEKIEGQKVLKVLSKIFVGAVDFDVAPEIVVEVFRTCGPIISCNFKIDQKTQKHAGFGFLEFSLPEAAYLAVKFYSGLRIGCRLIKVGRPTNVFNPDTVIDELVNMNSSHSRVYVANIHSKITSTELQEVFEVFGKIVSVTMHSKGFAFVEFTDAIVAQEAIEKLNGFDLGGQRLRVCQAFTDLECAFDDTFLFRYCSDTPPVNSESALKTAQLIVAIGVDIGGHEASFAVPPASAVNLIPQSLFAVQQNSNKPPISAVTLNPQPSLNLDVSLPSDLPAILAFIQSKSQNVPTTCSSTSTVSKGWMSANLPEKSIQYDPSNTHQEFLISDMDEEEKVEAQSSQTKTNGNDLQSAFEISKSQGVIKPVSTVKPTIKIKLESKSSSLSDKTISKSLIGGYNDSTIPPVLIATREEDEEEKARKEFSEMFFKSFGQPKDNKISTGIDSNRDVIPRKIMRVDPFIVNCDNKASRKQDINFTSSTSSTVQTATNTSVSKTVLVSPYETLNNKESKDNNLHNDTNVQLIRKSSVTRDLQTNNNDVRSRACMPLNVKPYPIQLKNDNERSLGYHLSKSEESRMPLKVKPYPIQLKNDELKKVSVEKRHNIIRDDFTEKDNRELYSLDYSLQNEKGLGRAIIKDPHMKREMRNEKRFREVHLSDESSHCAKKNESNCDKFYTPDGCVSKELSPLNRSPDDRCFLIKVSPETPTGKSSKDKNLAKYKEVGHVQDGSLSCSKEKEIRSGIMNYSENSYVLRPRLMSPDRQLMSAKETGLSGREKSSDRHSAYYNHKRSIRETNVDRRNYFEEFDSPRSNEQIPDKQVDNELDYRQMLRENTLDRLRTSYRNLDKRKNEPGDKCGDRLTIDYAKHRLVSEGDKTSVSIKQYYQKKFSQKTIDTKYQYKNEIDCYTTDNKTTDYYSLPHNSIPYEKTYKPDKTVYHNHNYSDNNKTYKVIDYKNPNLRYKNQDSDTSDSDFDISSSLKVIVLKTFISLFDVDKKLEDLITEECSQFGKVVEVFFYEQQLEDGGSAVDILVRFDSALAADRAVGAMNGRTIIGREIKALLYEDDV